MPRFLRRVRSEQLLLRSSGVARPANRDDGPAINESGAYYDHEKLDQGCMASFSTLKPFMRAFYSANKRTKSKNVPPSGSWPKQPPGDGITCQAR